MRAPFITSLLATAWIVGAGCASAPPQQDTPVVSRDRDCTNAGYDPLHVASSNADTARDPEIESLLNQSADPRLAWVNRQMYLSLRSLDGELRRERRVAECEHPQSSQTLEARSDGAGGGGGVIGGSGAMAGGTATGGANSAVPSAPSAIAMQSAAAQSSMTSGTTAAQARSTLVRKSSLSSGGSGGNGATAQKISAGSDNDIVARRLRKAAEQETDPALRAKLWKEYTDYRQGMSVR